MAKKNEFIFNIGFNRENPDHVKVAGILNRLGHGKAGVSGRGRCWRMRVRDCIEGILLMELIIGNWSSLYGK